MFVKPMTLHQEAAYGPRHPQSDCGPFGHKDRHLLSRHAFDQFGRHDDALRIFARNAAHQQVDHMLRLTPDPD
jgi:hypothetical protein